MRKNSLASHVLANFGGSVVPLLVSIITIPLYLKAVGTARYGVLAIVWLFVGYFSLLDFGISRATTNNIAKLPRDDSAGQLRVLWTALWMNGGMALVAVMLLLLLGGQGLARIPMDDAALHRELLAALPWIIALVPMVLISAILVGALEAKERFGLVNSQQIVGAVGVQVAPLVVALYVGADLNLLMGAIFAARFLALVMLALMVWKCLPVNRICGVDRATLSQLFRYGSWASVSGFLSPILDALDRFVIGATVGVVGVAAYNIPFSLVDKIKILPRSISRAVFPRLSASGDAEAKDLLGDLCKVVSTLVGSIAIVGILSVDRLLTIWIGPALAEASTPIAMILLCGALMNAVATLPFAYVHARGLPDLTAKIHLWEVAPFVAVLWLLCQQFGVLGAAMAWSLRMGVDAALMCVFSGLPRNAALYISSQVLISVSLVAWKLFFNPGWQLTLGIGLVALSGCAALGYDATRRLVRREAA